MFPPIYIINLAKDTERKEKIKKQCDEQNLSYTFIDAVYGKLLPKEIIQQVATPLCANTCTLPMIGCGLSHIKAWQQIYRDGHEWAIILEDDAILKKNIKETFETYKQQFPEDWDLIYLGCQGACTMESYTPLEWMSLVSGTLIQTAKPYKKINDNIFIPQFPIGTHAYMINRKFCEKMMNIKLTTHIDLQLAQTNTIKKYGVSPKLVCVNTADSSISSRNYPHMTLNKLSTIKQRGMDFGWVMTEPQMQLFGLEFNLMSYICFLFAFILQLYTKHAWKILTIMHIPELLFTIINKSSFGGLENCLIFHLVGLGLGYLINTKLRRIAQ